MPAQDWTDVAYSTQALWDCSWKEWDRSLSPQPQGPHFVQRKIRTLVLKELLKWCHSQFFLTLASFTRVTVSNGVYGSVLMASLGNKNFAALYWFCSFFYKIFWNFRSYEIQMPGKCWPAYTFLAYVWCYCFQILVTPPLMLQECIFYAIKNTQLFVIVNSAGHWSLWPGGTTGGLDTTF